MMSEKAVAGGGTEDLLESRRLEAENTAGNITADDSGYDGKSTGTSSNNNREMSPEELHELGGSSLQRFRRFGKLKDIHEAIAYGMQALNLTPKDHRELPDRLESLGGAHYDRFQRLGYLSDIKQAIEYFTRAVDSTPTDHSDLPGRLANLGVIVL
ncbi:hypothetical protein B0J17DRAFT_54579 [Rhizoctonia solani]|nr:hypothetical protein B0J17DRAFT_54579 [Rhizoctonia solani]